MDWNFVFYQPPIYEEICWYLDFLDICHLCDASKTVLELAPTIFGQCCYFKYEDVRDAEKRIATNRLPPRYIDHLIAYRGRGNLNSCLDFCFSEDFPTSANVVKRFVKNGMDPKAALSVVTAYVRCDQEWVESVVFLLQNGAPVHTGGQYEHINSWGDRCFINDTNIFFPFVIDEWCEPSILTFNSLILRLHQELPDLFDELEKEYLLALKQLWRSHDVIYGMGRWKSAIGRLPK